MDLKRGKIEFSSEEEIYHFFKSPRPEHFVSYQDYRGIFQYDSSYIQKINNYILNGYAQYRNHCFSQLLAYKYVPIALVTAIQLLRLRPPPVLTPFLFVYAVDYYFLDYMLWKNRNEKIINIQEAFNYKLIKKEKQIKRNRYLNSYLGLVNQRESKSTPQRWIDVEIFTPYILVNGVYDPAQSYCFLTKQYSIYAGLANLGTSVIEGVWETLKEDVELFGEFKRQDKMKQESKYIQSLLDANIQPNYRTYWVNVLEEKIQNLLEIVNYQFRGSSKKVEWKFYDLVTTRTYIEKDPPKIRVANNTSQLLIYYSLISLPYILLRFLRRG